MSEELVSALALSAQELGVDREIGLDVGDQFETQPSLEELQEGIALSDPAPVYG